MNEFDDKIRRSKNAIEESNINNPSYIYNQALENEVKHKTKFSFKRALAPSLAILLLVGFAAIVFIVHGQRFDLDSIDRNTNGARTISSTKEYQAIFDKIKKKYDYGSIVWTGGIVSATAEDESGIPTIKGETGSPGDTNTSDNPVYETNNQEEEVKEADIVKVDGDYIYYIPAYNYNEEKSNYVYKLKGQENNCVIEGSIEFARSKEFVAIYSNGTAYDYITPIPSDMFIYNDYLIVRIDKRYKVADYQDYYANYVRHYSKYNTEIRIYNKNDLSLANSYEFEGENLAIRLIDNQLYLVNRLSLGLDTYYPSIYIDEQKQNIDVTTIQYYPYLLDDSDTLVSIIRITLDEEIKMENLELIIPSTKIVYVDKSGIYMTSYNTHYEESDNYAKYSYTETCIFPISIKEELEIQNMLKIKGAVSDRYWIDAYDNYLRIASTGREYFYDYYLRENGVQYLKMVSSETFNLLTIFKKDENGIWDYYASIDEGLGEVGEQIKSARFNDNYCTIVTFKQTDPLYYIDLTDPLNPIITSELKISGYSGYQHPYKDNYVIGVGYEADKNGVIKGLKISLFDISDKDNIQIVGNSLLLLRNDYVAYYNTNAINDPRAFMFDLSRDTFGFDIVGMGRDYETGEWHYNNTYCVFKIDVSSNNPISIVLEKVVNDNTNSYDNTRMVFIGSTYYLLNTNCIYVYNNSFDLLETIELN